MIDASAVRNRAMEWLSFRYRRDGRALLGDRARVQPRPLDDQWDFSGNGDGTLFYPGTPARIGGTTHVPVASIRLKMIREGMEDYEYLKLLADAGDADARARRSPTRSSRTRTRPRSRRERLMAARERIARRIVELGGGALDPRGRRIPRRAPRASWRTRPEAARPGGAARASSRSAVWPCGRRSGAGGVAR